MSNHYYVRAVRITRSWFGTKNFYQPISNECGDHAIISRVDDMDSVWGFETEAAAWSVIDRAILDDRDRDYECRNYYDREDFHTDG
jgi:hypothetical protein